MCGIAGIVRADPRRPVSELALRRMARALRHRGPDGFGLVLDAGAGLAATRLAIVDRRGGWQPMHGPAGTVLAYNGEVFNHPELRAELGATGGDTVSASDTEVVLRLLERDGIDVLHRLNGQFALAWWEPLRRRLTLARDRFGIHPLQVAELPDGSLAFASEAKALFATGEVSAAPDPAGLDDVFALWGPQPPRTAFRDVGQLGPGELLVWEGGRIAARRRWWRPEPDPAAAVPEADLDELLRDSVRLRLRADVPVGAYLSGGLDSSLICALAQAETDHDLRTFSVAFRDPRYDERAFQQAVATALGTTHHVVEVGAEDIAAAFPAVVRQAETPLVRTAPVPLWLLARETRAQGITVVATGEGADELFWGYDLLKEVALRRMHGHDPARAAALLDGLYPELAAAPRGEAWRRSLLEAAAVDDPLGSHRTRVAAGSALRALLHPDVVAAAGEEAALARLAGGLPAGFAERDPLERAAHLELTTLLPGYLLAAQGDRVALAHGVEARFPFLDDRVFATAALLPERRKLDGPVDKVALRDLARRVLPPAIAARPKQPYRAPALDPFFAGAPPAWVAELLAPAAVREVGLFDAGRVATLARRCREGRVRGVREEMALVGVLSTQLWHHAFARTGGPPPAETAEPRVHLDLSAVPPVESAA